VADVFDALTAARPYRGEMSAIEAIGIMMPDTGHRLNGDAIDALRGLSHPLKVEQDRLSWDGGVA